MNRNYKIVYTKRALKEKKRMQNEGFSDKITSLLDLIAENPFADYPPFEKLIGDLKGLYSRRINKQHRLVYAVCEDEKVIKVVSMWTHYE